MGWVLMSERDVQRIEVLTEVLAGKRTVASAAIVLAVSTRQVGRLLIRFRADGGGGLVHRGRGQASNHRANAGVREYALELVKTRYADFGPTLAIEMLLDKHGIKVGRETLRTWMVEAGMWLMMEDSSPKPRASVWKTLTAIVDVKIGKLRPNVPIKKSMTRMALRSLRPQT